MPISMPVAVRRPARFVARRGVPGQSGYGGMVEPRRLDGHQPSPHQCTPIRVFAGDAVRGAGFAVSRFWVSALPSRFARAGAPSGFGSSRPNAARAEGRPGFASLGYCTRSAAKCKTRCHAAAFASSRPKLGGGAVLADGLDALGSGVPTHGGTVSVKRCRAAFVLGQVHGLALLTSGVQTCAVALVLLDGFGADRCTEDGTSFTA